MSKANEYVVDLLKKLREDISQIKHMLFTEKPKSESDSNHGPRQYVIHAEHENTESTDKEDDSIRATLHPPEAIRVEAKTDESEKKWFNDRHFLLSCVGIGLAAGVGVIYMLQLSAMRAGMRIDQRPWIKVSLDFSVLQVANPVSGKAHLANNGKTPARSVHGDFVVEMVKNGEQPKFDYPWPYTRFTAGTIYPNDPLNDVEIVKLVQESQSVEPRPEPLPTSAFNDFGHGKIFYVVYGMVYYSDFFGVDHWTKICQPMIPSNTSGTWTFKACTDYGDIDTN